MDTLKPYREKAEAKAKKCVEDIIKRTITIEKDGWVWIKDGEKETGLGDVNVDVIIKDLRK